METSAVAALCSERGVRFLSIRVVSDEAEVDLPPEIATLMTRSGSYRVGAALRAIWNRPSSLKDFWALHEHAQEAADRLARFMVGALRTARLKDHPRSTVQSCSQFVQSFIPRKVQALHGRAVRLFQIPLFSNQGIGSHQTR